MKIATWNVNSIRKRLPLIIEWLEQHQPDALCLQETKVQDSEFPALAFLTAGYQAAFRGMKTFNGVAILTRKTPEDVQFGFHAGPDNEDVRVMRATLDGVTIVNTYVPQGYKIDTDKYEYKLEWFRRVRRYFNENFAPTQPLVWVGDINVAPEPIDVYHPDRRVNDPDFHINARNAFKETLTWGFTDLFRKLHPDRVQYTYWDYFRNALENNWGWRIDHILATQPLAAACTRIEVDMEPRRKPIASDHTVVWAEFDWGAQ